MDESDLKSFIESVIADMVAAGELEGGEDEEGEEEEEESEEEVEINKTEMKENYGMEKEPMNEASDAIELAKMLSVSLPVAKAIMVAADLADLGIKVKKLVLLTFA
jgi:hypothetical protein